MKKRVFIIHGWDASPDANWFPWVKKELEKSDFEVVAAQMPDAGLPKQEKWLAFMNEIIGSSDAETFLIGHSLGAIAILRFLENLKGAQKIGGAILVSGFAESLGLAVEIENFFATPVDFEKVRSRCEKFVVINSDDDPYVPLEQGRRMCEKLGGKFLVMHKAGHINMGSGNFELPIVVDELLKFQNEAAMKTLKFKDDLARMILAGEKRSTWRIFDDKDLQVGDRVLLINSENKSSFARAVLTKVSEKQLGEITDEDADGHEKFSSKEELLKTFQTFYGKDVTFETTVKIIHFEII